MITCSAPITEDHVKDLVAGKQTEPIEFTWKSGKKGLARLKGYPIKGEGENKKFKLDFDFIN